MTIEILHRDDLALGGFAGLKEHRLVMSQRLFGSGANSGSWSGLAGFVYLADASFNPNGETRMHDHKKIDVISIMLEGRIAHQGSLEHGQELVAGDVQVQCSGVEGFSHNEINPDNTPNRMLQIWVLPEQRGQSASYKIYKLDAAEVTRIYGGNSDQNDTVPSHTVIEVVSLKASQHFVLEKPFLAYLAVGNAIVDNQNLKDGDLFKGERLDFIATSNIILIVVYKI